MIQRGAHKISCIPVLVFKIGWFTYKKKLLKYCRLAKLLPKLFFLLNAKVNQNVDVRLRHSTRFLNCFATCPESPSVRGFVASLPVRLLFKYLPNCIFPGFVIAAMRHVNWADETGLNPLYTYLNNWWTGKDVTKPRALGLLGHSIAIRPKT